VPHGQARAVTEVARRQGADLIVIGKRRHGRVGDAVHDETASHVFDHPPWPFEDLSGFLSGKRAVCAPFRRLVVECK
jgi:hypothetical protein